MAANNFIMFSRYLSAANSDLLLYKARLSELELVDREQYPELKREQESYVDRVSHASAHLNDFLSRQKDARIQMTTRVDALVLKHDQKIILEYPETKLCQRETSSTAAFQVPSDLSTLHREISTYRNTTLKRHTSYYSTLIPKFVTPAANSLSMIYRSYKNTFNP
jgi:hypothetical protein